MNAFLACLAGTGLLGACGGAGFAAATNEHGESDTVRVAYRQQDAAALQDLGASGFSARLRGMAIAIPPATPVC
jgi:hypothetical protein